MVTMSVVLGVLTAMILEMSLALVLCLSFSLESICTGFLWQALCVALTVLEWLVEVCLPGE